MIAGQAPRFAWRPNADGTIRTISEACAIARRWGVAIPDDVRFFVDESGYLDADTTAKTTTFRECAGTMIDWSWLFNQSGKIPFLIRQDIMQSDEAIVAVIGHEMYELERLRVAFGQGAPIEHWEAETSPHHPDNFHCQAWDYADALVAKMRGEK